MVRVSIAILCAIFFLIPVWTAAAIEPRDVSYFCVAEVAAGLAYDDATKKWVGTRFKVTEKYVLRLKFIDSTLSPNSWDHGSTYNNFRITIAEAGNNTANTCFSQSGNQPTISVSPNNYLSCNSAYSQYNFNLTTNRYLKVYDVGYLDGSDNNENTPAVTGGICTKIE